MTSHYPQQPYGGSQPYQNPQQYQYQQPYQQFPTRRPPGPATLGICGLIMGSAALVLSVVWDFVCVAQIRSAIASNYSEYYDALPSRAMGAITTAVFVQVILSLVGTAGLVISIVATATNKGRPAAIAGIVIAAVAPIISYLVFFMALASLPLDPDVWDTWDEDYMVLIPHLLLHLH